MLGLWMCILGLFGVKVKGIYHLMLGLLMTLVHVDHGQFKY